VNADVRQPERTTRSDSEVRWCEAGALGHTRQHAWPNLFIVVEREDEIRPAFALECSMRARLAFDHPADSKECSQYAASFGGWPVAHAAWKVTLSNSAGASRCSRRSAITRSANA
jgi:hypothetical protein